MVMPIWERIPIPGVILTQERGQVQERLLIPAGTGTVRTGIKVKTEEKTGRIGEE
jgi:hypothetical protein